jgi:hypothetical protein
LLSISMNAVSRAACESDPAGAAAAGVEAGVCFSVPDCCASEVFTAAKTAVESAKNAVRHA